MNKTRKIKEIIGKVIQENGFAYIRCEKRIIYDFKRQVDDVEQHVYVQQHNIVDQEYKIMLYTTAKGHGMKEIGTILPEYESKEYWKAESDEEFISVMEFFAQFLKDYGLEELDKMLVEKPDSFETPERKAWFKEHRKELFEKYEAIYHVMDEDRTYDRLMKIDKILYENREAEEDEESQKIVQELWLGMAAILTEIVLQMPNATIMYDTYHIEVHLPSKYTDWIIMPVDTIVQGWLRYHLNLIQSKDYVRNDVYLFLEEFIRGEIR
ncbi:hypothetical protein SAMN04487884_1031 [Butyrivibrio fibrisolvens]|uniref:Uncharacterized protein n=1 Tax=Butyrivibrio fibrisolvens TaxID=831 RepID=A0A1H9M993_BUTFI|nr:hypothetical protein [Butyrivibrio fibrisolvens]SER20039.1 hypothetical protein SAMN04487884_1031 [Butyrivibrio fibrisolvens]